MQDLRSAGEEEMIETALSLGEKAFRGRQLFQWIHGRRVQDFHEMTNLPAGFRLKLQDSFRVSGVSSLKMPNQKNTSGLNLPFFLRCL